MVRGFEERFGVGGLLAGRREAEVVAWTQSSMTVIDVEPDIDMGDELTLFRCILFDGAIVKWGELGPWRLECGLLWLVDCGFTR